MSEQTEAANKTTEKASFSAKNKTRTKTLKTCKQGLLTSDSGTNGSNPSSVLAAASPQQDLKKFAAIFGDCAGLLMHSPGHKQYRLQDLEWLLLPALQFNQFTILSGAPKDNPEIQLPLGLALWAKVSPEVDEALSVNFSGPLQLKPEDWKSGDIPWLIDIVGAPEVARILVAQVSRSAFSGQDMKMRVKTKDGVVEVKTVKAVEEGAAEG